MGWSAGARWRAAWSLGAVAGALALTATPAARAPAATPAAPAQLVTPAPAPVALGQPRTPLKRCPASDYNLRTAAEHVDGAFVGVAWFSLRGPFSCRLRVRLRFSVQPARDAYFDPVSTLAAVQGNPATVTVDGPLRPGHVVIRAWEWANWCSSRGRFVLLSIPRGAPDKAAWSAVGRPPDCTAPESASTLRAFAPKLPACRPHQYRLVAFGEGYREREVGNVAIALRGSKLCRLRTRLTFSVQSQARSSWVSASVSGDPQQVTVGAVLEPRDDVEVFWAWSNWCGDGQALRWFVADPHHRAKRAAVAPACVLPSATSTLAPFYDPPAPVRP
jgi:hypothetical protein